MTKTIHPANAERQYWLVKTEPSSYSFDDLWNAPGRRTTWDGVRNYQARNYLREEMKKGDLVLVYHSGSEPGVAGIAEVIREGYPDPTAFDPKEPHYDPRSRKAEPSWFMVDLRAVERFPRPLPLSVLRQQPDLEGMPLLQRGNRLSVQKVGPAEWNAVIRTGKTQAGTK